MDVEDKRIDRQTQIQILTDILDGISKTEIFKKHSISSDEYSEIKDTLLKQIKEKTDKAEITSYAVRYFRNLAKERRFTAEAKEMGLSVSMTKLLNQIIMGNSRPTYGVIFSLRRQISPAQWVYMESEKLPAPVDFKPVIEEKYPAYDFPTRNELAKQKTLGHLFFDIIREGQVLTRFCAIHNCPLMEAANFIYMKKNRNGEIRYTHRPTVPFITKFKEAIHPDFWFVYPEEVSAQTMRDMRLSAEEWVFRLRNL